MGADFLLLWLLSNSRSLTATWSDTFSPFRTHRKELACCQKNNFLLFFFCFVFSHCDYSPRLSSLLYFFFYFLCIQSLHPFQLHSSFFLVFNLSSSASLFSPEAPCNANTTCSEGKWIIEATAAIPSVQKWAAEEGMREGRDGWGNEGERDGEGRFVSTNTGSAGCKESVVCSQHFYSGSV